MLNESIKMSISKGEGKIINILNKAKIVFIKEFQPSDCRNGHLRFDFFLPSYNILIEYDGEQHFKFIKRFYATQRDWKAAIERDRIKNAYALAKHLQLYRIPFWELNNISTFQDLIQERFLVHNKFHNDSLIIK